METACSAILARVAKVSDEQQEDFFNEDPASESEDDLAFSPPEAISTAVVTGTDWTAETILRQLERGNIELNPRFQRRETWDDARKSAFIESLILGLPIPQLVLAERKDQRGSYIVIDGKQRLIALRRFAATDATDSGDNFAPLHLRKLEVRPDLEGMTLADLQNSPDHAGDVSAFENETIRTVVVRAWPDEDFLYRVFLRLNTGSVQLSPQELRQALHPGHFVDFADDRSAKSEAIQQALNLKRPDFRMRDVELLIRFFAFAFYLQDYNGNLKQFLDSTCQILNECWDTEKEAIFEAADHCDAAIETTLSIFGKTAFRRFSPDNERAPFNRAVFDVMTFYFRFPEIRQASEESGDAVVSAFNDLCQNDAAFLESITSTTKSIPATHTRLKHWGDALNNVLDVEVPTPMLADNRIHP
jgi:Protein of unknown function DUF262